MCVFPDMQTGKFEELLSGVRSEFKFGSLQVCMHAQDWVHPLWPDHATDPNPIHISTPSHLDEVAGDWAPYWAWEGLGGQPLGKVTLTMHRMLTNWPQVLTRLTNWLQHFRLAKIVLKHLRRYHSLRSPQCGKWLVPELIEHLNS